MAKIRMKTTLGSTNEQVFSSFLAAAAARGVKEKTLDTYKQHFRSISKRLNTSLSIKDLSKEDLDNSLRALSLFTSIKRNSIRSSILKILLHSNLGSRHPHLHSTYQEYRHGTLA